MTSDELKSKFTQAYRIIAAEKKMREFVFRDKPIVLAAKLAEIDRLLALVTELKDFCKAHVDDAYEQPTLLDAPRKADYG